MAVFWLNCQTYYFLHSWQHPRGIILLSSIGRIISHFLQCWQVLWFLSLIVMQLMKAPHFSQVLMRYRIVYPLCLEISGQHWDKTPLAFYALVFLAQDCRGKSDKSRGMEGWVVDDSAFLGICGDESVSLFPRTLGIILSVLTFFLLLSIFWSAIIKQLWQSPWVSITSLYGIKSIQQFSHPTHVSQFLFIFELLHPIKLLHPQHIFANFCIGILHTLDR